MKPPIVILHGWGLTGSLYKPLGDILRKHKYPVYAPDMPGFGNESAPDYAWGLTEYAQFLSHFLKKNGILKPIFIGHSFGGRVALKFQELYPGQTTALILSGTPGFTPIPRKKLMLFITIGKVGKFFASLVPFPSFRDAIRRWYYYVVGARDFYRAQGVMRSVFKTIVQENLLIPMQSVQCPCFLIWGEHDLIVPLKISEQMQTVIAHARPDVIPDADHGVPYKRPEEFAAVVINFL